MFPSSFPSIFQITFTFTNTCTHFISFSSITKVRIYIYEILVCTMYQLVMGFFKVLYFSFKASMLFTFTCQYRCDIFFRQRPKTRLRPSKFEFDLLLRVCHIIYNSNLHHDYKTWNFINKILSLYFKLF